jgi:hypothetical protein
VTEGYQIYADFLKSLVDAEASRKASLEQRGIAVITTSGILVTLLYGLATITTSSKTLHLPPGSIDWLKASSVMFVLAAVTGIAVNLPLLYGQAKLTEEDLQKAWDDTAPDAQATVTSVRIKRLKAAQRANNIKAWILMSSVSFEVGAIALLSYSFSYYTG